MELCRRLAGGMRGMTDKERLERIKERVNYHDHLDDDIEFLIEQAERVQELEKWRNEVTNNVAVRNAEYAKCREQNKRYREILSYVREIDCIDWNKEELAEMA